MIQLKTNIFITLSAVVLTALSFTACGGNDTQSSAQGKSKGSRSPKVLPVEAQVLESTTLARSVRSVGTILADEMVELCFETSGKVVEITFDEGRLVDEGAVLARINDAPLQAELKRLQASLPVAENREARKRELLKTEAISRDDYDESLATLAQLQANIEQVQANIDKCILRAPFSGIVGLRNISEGASVTTGTSVAQLAKTDKLKIEFAYPEQYASLVGVGSEISFRVTDNSELHIARVYAVESSIDESTKSLKARAMFNNAQGLLSPGRFVSVEIKLADKPDAIMIANEAVTLEMGKAYVFRCKGGKAFTQEIETGFRNEHSLEVVSGLSVGDTIATTGLMQLRPGMPVDITNL